jgi:hypothetical protein
LFVFLLTLLFIRSSSSQDMRIQISTDSTPVKGASCVKLDLLSSLRIAYTSINLTLHTGFYKVGWNEKVTYLVPKINGDYEYDKITIDDSNKVWYCFYDGANSIRFGTFEDGKWKESGSLPYKTFQITTLKNGDHLCLFPDDKNIYDISGIRGICIKDSTISNILIASKYPYQLIMGGYINTSPILEPVFWEDNLYYAINYEKKNGLTGSRISSISYIESLKYNKQTIIANTDRDGSDYSGWKNDILGLGNTQKHVIIAGAKIYFDVEQSLKKYSYIIYQADTVIRRVWNSVLIPNDAQPITQVYFSRNANILALVYLNNNLYNVKVLKDTTWYKTKIINEDTLVTNKSETRVFVEKDSIVWIAYTGIKGTQRHLFLQKVIPNWEIDDEATGVEEKTTFQKNSEYKLYQNYPNPFNPATNIIFTIGADERSTISGEVLVQLKVYDVLGREVAVLVNELRKPGKYEIPFSGVSLPSGIYFYRLRAGEYTDIKRMLLIK